MEVLIYIIVSATIISYRNWLYMDIAEGAGYFQRVAQMPTTNNRYSEWR